MIVPTHNRFVMFGEKLNEKLNLCRLWGASRARGRRAGGASPTRGVCRVYRAQKFIETNITSGRTR